MSVVASVSSAFARTRVAPRPDRRSTLAPAASRCAPRRGRGLAPAARCLDDARDGSARVASSSSRPRISDDFIVPRLTDTFALEPVPSPFAEGGEKFGYGLGQKFVDDDDCVLLNALRYEALECGGGANALADTAEGVSAACPLPGAEEWHGRWAMRAGPRERIFFQPEKVRAAIVTCGGLCPGLNDVIRQLVITLEEYGVEDIRGIRYGFRGFFETEGELRAPMKLTSKLVETIHLEGGSILGSSRGGSETSDIVDAVSEMELDFLFVIGGNGSHAGALAIDNACKDRGVCCSVIGIPKTIDNDILLLDRTFGFQTAVDEAINAIRSAAIEARSAYNGVGLVRLMGRQSGFIAMNASLASGEVDVCLIPEIDTPLEGPGGILAHVRRVLNKKEHCVVVVAEGAGQDILGKMGETDASGNPVLQNFAKFVQAEMKEKLADLTPDIKYIDPTYMVRACPTNSSDAIYCSILGQNAVHAAFAGLTGATVGLCNGHYVYLPIRPLISRAREVDPEGRMWERLRLAINQPVYRVVEESGANEATPAR
jgi:6-phosphofructokinase 1